VGGLGLAETSIHKLSAVKVARLKTAGLHGDGGGLWLQVTPSGGRSWAFRFMLGGRARQMGLGPLHSVSLAEAREKARMCRRQLLEGIDPIEARHSAAMAVQADAALGRRFRQCAEAFLGSHEAGWKNDKHRAQWTATLVTYVYPAIGSLSVAAIETGHVCKILEPIWTSKPETASRVRGRIERVLDWATARGLRSGHNPARWRGHLDKLLPQRSKVQKVRHHPALPWQQVPAFMAELRANGSFSARALEFTILTGARTNEALGATWDEIDPEAWIWIIPASRMKAGREHRIPLCPSAAALLQALSRVKGSDYLFPGNRPKRPLSNMAMLELLRGLRPGAGLTVHGFRSSLRDWAGEATHHPREVIEAALAHVIANKTEAAYRRGDALEKRRTLMNDWCAYCGGASV
jgi:integrase